MDLDLRLQRLYDRVELVAGVGDIGAGTLCVMSFAAGLAGEGHTDSPACASPVVRSFAIALNDSVPHDVRQRLKPFAPRIVGTRDGLDAARAEVLRRALAKEILPRAAALGALPDRAAPAPPRAGLAARLWARLRGREDADWCLAGLVERAGRTARGPHCGVHLAGEVMQLIDLCAGVAEDAREQEWWWNEALGLLDRLCETGERRPSARAARVRADRVARLERALGTEKERQKGACPDRDARLRPRSRPAVAAGVRDARLGIA
jgi:hypothetical protein